MNMERLQKVLVNILFRVRMIPEEAFTYVHSGSTITEDQNN